MIEDIEKYMLYDLNVYKDKSLFTKKLKSINFSKQKNTFTKTIDDYTPKNDNDYTSKNDNDYTPKNVNDILFWCFYIIDKGIESYELLGSDIYNIIKEKNKKIEYINVLRNNKELLKKAKINKLNEIENFLVTENLINIKTFVSLLVVNNYNIFFIYKNMYYELINDEKNKLHIITKNDDNTFKLEVDINMTNINEYREKYFNINDYNFKLKSISNYKLDELIEISKKLNIDICLKKLKKDIYEEICNYIA